MAPLFRDVVPVGPVDKGCGMSDAEFVRTVGAKLNERREAVGQWFAGAFFPPLRGCIDPLRPNNLSWYLDVQLARLANPKDDTEREDATDALFGSGWRHVLVSVGNTRQQFLDDAVRAEYSRGEATGLFRAFEAGLDAYRGAAEIIKGSPGLSAARKRIIRDGVREHSCPAFQALDACMEDVRKGRAAAETPVWNADAGELQYGGETKTYANPAENQRRILSAFQEAGWPTAIDDPTPPRPRIEVGRFGKKIKDGRLNQTIRSLNVSIPFLRFAGTGNGQGIRWEPRELT
jgi:hypothetical protein